MDQTTVTEGLHKQFNSIRNSRSKWTNIVVKSGELFTTLTYNLVRELVSLRSNKREDLWSIDLIPECSPACHLFLSGDPIGAAHLAAAKRIDEDYASLENLLEQTRSCIVLIEKSVQCFSALRKLKMNVPPSILDSPVSTPASNSKMRSKHGRHSNSPILTAEYIPWSAIQAEADALLRRLRSDLTFREGLLRTLTYNYLTTGDSSGFQRLSFLWRQADQLIKWENLLGLEEHIEHVFG